jgi:3-oxoacyl-[acyl-carrier-protein] synthase-1
LGSLAKVTAVATSKETNLIKTESVCVGRGLSEAVKSVISRLPNAETKVDSVICDLNGEAYRADEYGFTVARTSDRFEDSSGYLAPADCWGDVGAASGPLFIVLLVAAARRGYARGPYTLLCTSSEHGHRSAALFYADVSPAAPGAGRRV